MRYDQLRPKYRAFLQGFPVTMVTYYVAIMTACHSVIIAVSYGNTTLLPRDSVKVSIFLISEALESVETGLTHLKDVRAKIFLSIEFFYIFTAGR